MSSDSSAPEIEGLAFVEHLGTGGYSDVFLYERRVPRMKLAVKVLKEGRLREAQLAQFAAEAEAMAELADHPNIVQVFSTGTTVQGRPYLVMKYYPPPNLGARAARERFSVADVLRTGVKVASAVETAHRAGILHRDIKPANILVSQYGEPGLTDFGIAGRTADTAEDDDLGVSIPWSPPEVLSGESNGSAQADIYALSATLWHLLVGRSPFEIAGGDNAPRALMSRILRTPPPATGRADVSASLERLLQHAMAKNPAIRPRTALEFARGLQGVEQELRFARTEIVTGDSGGVPPRSNPAAGEPSRPVDGGDATRLRAPTRVPAQTSRSRFQTPATGTPPAGGRPPADAPPTVARPARPHPAAVADDSGAPGGGAVDPPRPHPGGVDAGPATVLRPARPQTTPPPGTDPLGDPAPGHKSGTKTKWVVLGASAALVVAVVAAIVFSSGGGSADRRGDTGHTSGPTQQLAGFDPPQQPVVTATRQAAHGPVTFTWSYNNPRKGDYFLWSEGSQKVQHRESTAQVVLPAPETGKVCLTVEVMRSDGQSSLPSDRACG